MISRRYPGIPIQWPLVASTVSPGRVLIPPFMEIEKKLPKSRLGARLKRRSTIAYRTCAERQTEKQLYGLACHERSRSTRSHLLRPCVTQRSRSPARPPAQAALIHATAVNMTKAPG